VNAMFSHGYAVLYATFALACTGAGLDLSRGALYGVVEPVPGGGGACVLDLMEPAMVPMVDRVIVKWQPGELLRGGMRLPDGAYFRRN
jgi:CRISPR/Cas system-associated endonuclease Cas1